MALNFQTRVDYVEMDGYKAGEVKIMTHTHDLTPSPDGDFNQKSCDSDSVNNFSELQGPAKQAQLEFMRKENSLL